MNTNQRTIAWLNSAKGISNRKIEKILEYFNYNTSYLWDNFENEKYNLKMLDLNVISDLSTSKIDFEEKLLIKLYEEHVSIVTSFDDEYPLKLKNIEGAPYILYYKGNLNKINDISIAVVGSRKATAYGKWAADKLTGEMAELGINIISGLAAGIDAVAHKTAIKFNAKTVGVIGSGIDIVYPRSNERLYEEIEEKSGTILTEFPFGMQPMSNNFHSRNRIISGLSDGVLVIEAQERSGTLITAGHAADQGREIFAVPGNIDSLYSKGTNSLIRDGAKVTTCIDDIIDEIPELKEKVRKKLIIDYSCLTDEEIIILDCLKSGKKPFVEINEITNIEAKTLLSLLTLLEMKGIVKQLAGNIFILA